MPDTRKSTILVPRYGLASVAGVVVLLMLFLWDSHRAEKERATGESKNYAWLLEKEAKAVFERADNALAEIPEHLQAADIISGKTPPKIADILKLRGERILEVDAFNVFNSQGDLVSTSAQSMPQLNIADRPYFQKIKAHPELGRVFSDPLISKTTLKPSIILSRALLSRDGKFAGSVEAVVGLDRFTKFYSAINLGSLGVIAMLTIDGHRQLARFPERSDLINRPMANPVQSAIDQALNQGTLEYDSPVDHVRRIVSFRTIENYPFYIQVGLSNEDILAQWKSKAIYLSLAVCLFCAMLLFFLWRDYQSRMALLATSEKLRILNETLEDRVAAEVQKNLEQTKLMIHQSRLAAMGEMIGNIAHQWRQPLNSLALIDENIRDAYDCNELSRERLEELLIHSETIVRRLSTTIDDFRNFFRPDRDKKEFDIYEAIDHVIDIVGESFYNSNVQIDYERGAPLRIAGYQNELSQVILSILTNARDAIAEKKTPSGVISIKVLDAGSKIVIRDNGGGIDEEILPRIFDPYFTTKTKGTGIGLYISKMLMEHMNGNILVRNLDAGAEFVLEISKI